MSHKINNRLKILLAEKENREGRKITYETVQNETGISPSTLVGFANNRVTRFDEVTLVKLCEYFNCDIGDLLVLQKN